jgi:phytoene synthase
LPAPVSGSLSAELNAAYAHCAQVISTQARNFWYGIRLLPPAKRRALSAVYAFARRADDIADGDRPQADKLTELHALRIQLDTVRESPSDPVLKALADAAERMPIHLEAFGELIDGCEADVRGSRYNTFDELVVYCRQVAGSIGRLSLGVFGADDLADASQLADSLGVALQLTNILRDVREDRLNGRVYLPTEDLDRFKVQLELDSDGNIADAQNVFAQLIEFEAARARDWYTTGLDLLPALDRRSAACCGAMAGIYVRLLRRISVDPAAPMRTRMTVPTWEKGLVAARCLAGLRP